MNGKVTNAIFTHEALVALRGGRVDWYPLVVRVFQCGPADRSLDCALKDRRNDRGDASSGLYFQERIGASRWKRYIVAFLGGVILMFGARLAGGCTSGHGISGSLQLALSGWLFFGSVFVSGIATALLMFGKENVRG